MDVLDHDDLDDEIEVDRSLDASSAGKDQASIFYSVGLHRSIG